MELKPAFSLLAIYIALAAFSCCSAEKTLGKFIHHFEPLNYDTKEIHSSHKKAVKQGEHYHMQFDAFGLRHKLRIRQDKELFTPDAVIQDGDGKPINLDHSSFITGEIVGEPGSKVHGVVEDGAFRGKIIGREGKFYVEPAKTYFEDPEFHSVIYREGDVQYDAKYADLSKRLPKLTERERREVHENNNERYRRATEEQMRKNVCKLKLFADDRFTSRFGGKTEAASKIVEHVAAVKTIYTDDFNTTKLDLYAPYGITFRVKQITIYTAENVPAKYNKDNLGIDPMLELLSEENHDDVCEAFLFTDRDFEGGILGLAWIGHPKKLGGICSKYSSGKSYNTGIVTTKLYGRFTPPRISEVTFAHELGHGFGSQHDPEGACSPGGTAGNYIMYSKATSGDRTNNEKFSTCSLKAIRDNVNVKRSNSYYSKCFSSGDEAICGNMIIEAGEQCDCGDKISCEQEGNCCNPPGTKDECRLKIYASCSLSQGPCCTKQCKHASNKVCRNSTTCIKEARCTGSAICPKIVVKDTKATCSDGRRVCGVKGDCSQSICTKYNLEECQCSAEDELCDICCKDPAKDGSKCLSAKHISQLPVALHTVRKIPGSPCSNMHGYCDVFSVCRMVDKSGPLKRLTERFFSVKGLKSTVKQYWWAILIGLLAGIIIVGLMVWLCTEYTPSSNPIREQKRPAKPLPKRKKKNQDRTQDAGRYSPTMEMEHQV